MLRSLQSLFYRVSNVGVLRCRDTEPCIVGYKDFTSYGLFIVHKLRISNLLTP